MSKRKYSKSKSNDLIDLMYGISILISMLVFLKSNSIKATIFAFLGSLAVVIAIIFLLKNENRKKLLSSGIDIVDKMSGEEFEKFLLAHFNNLGYVGHTTAKTNDFGADLVLHKNGVKMVLQAKRWQGKVGISAIQEIIAAIKYYRATKGIVITNSFFTKNAYELAKVNNIELWNRNKLIEIMSASRGKELASNVTSNLTSYQEENINIKVSDTRKICPRCNSELVIRNGKRGRFLGCSKYPSCRYIEDL